MKLSTRAKYGLRVVFLLGLARQDEPTSVATLVSQTDLSVKYLEQLCSMLRRGGIVRSERGANGGYFLARRAEEITVGEILNALDDGFDVGECLDGNCHDAYCPNKIIFKRLYDCIDGVLSSTTLADMINDFRCVR